MESGPCNIDDLQFLKRANILIFRKKNHSYVTMLSFQRIPERNRGDNPHKLGYNNVLQPPIAIVMYPIITGTSPHHHWCVVYNHFTDILSAERWVNSIKWWLCWLDCGYWLVIHDFTEKNWYELCHSLVGSMPSR